MLKNKSLLYGLGTGLIIGASLLQLMNAIPGGSGGISKSGMTAPAPEEMTRDQVKAAAAKYFNVYEKDVKVYLQADVDALIAQKVKEEQDKLAAQTPPAAPAEATQKEIYIYVASGQASGQVADMLVQSGVITDKKAFENEMTKKQLHDKVVVGVHAFKGPQTMEQVVGNITTP